MSRYIDADNLIKKMQERYNDLSSGDGYYDHFTQGYGDALSTVENEPTADVVKSVRCKDCKFCLIYNVDGAFPQKFLFCETRGVHDFVEEDEFCSRGERRKDDAEIH